jgi:hypothetical protein
VATFNRTATVAGARSFTVYELGAISLEEVSPRGGSYNVNLVRVVS